MEKKYTFSDLKQIIDVLRGENGCPWDKVQTHESLRKDMLEEAYEAVDAIDKNDMENLKEELGDVLMQVVFHSAIANENGNFTLDDVIQGVCEKMVYRHPHVFGTGNAKTPDEVLQKWETLKKQEKQIATQTQAMKQVPAAMPALLQAQKVQKKAADVGFDFCDVYAALEKVQEEILELQQEIKKENGNIEEEFGDILFATVNIARFLKINPEFALTKSTKKFINRFEYVENAVISAEKQLSDMTPEALDLLWDKAKSALSNEH